MFPDYFANKGSFINCIPEYGTNIFFDSKNICRTSPRKGPGYFAFFNQTQILPASFTALIIQTISNMSKTIMIYWVREITVSMANADFSMLSV